VLAFPHGAPTEGDAWSWEPNYDNDFFEPEVLLRGPRDGAIVMTIDQARNLLDDP